MIVVGGCYRETCAEPALRWTYGSGVRAAAVLGDRAERLITVADDESLLEARAVVGTVQIDAMHRTNPLTFAYDTPLSTPRLTFERDASDVRSFEVEAQDALVFGMVEVTPIVSAKRCVVDPQHSLTLAEIASIPTVNLTVVANTAEVTRLGAARSVDVAVRNMFRETPADLVVVKAGALGSLVFERDKEPVGVPAFVTASVFPIGSGDVFSAAFASAFFADGDPIAAAESASRRTSGYVATRQTAAVDVASRPGHPPSLLMLDRPPRVYVAASFEIPEQRWSARTLTSGIRDIGGYPIYPLEEIGPKTDPIVTATLDLEALDGCDSVALLADVSRIGPYFEVGWAASHGLPTVVMSSDQDPERFTMLRGTGASVYHDQSTTAYHSVWCALFHRYGDAAGGRLLLLSGGLDSSSVAALERPDRALFIDYGQRPAEAERAAANNVASHLGIELDNVKADLSSLGAGLLVGQEPRADSPSPEWFPFRNQFLVTVGAAHARNVGLRTVVLGLAEGDGIRHADGSARFVASIDATTRLQEGGVRVVAPFVHFDPARLVQASGLPQDVLNATHSCHRARTACGRCPGCARRTDILARARETLD